LHSRLEEDFLKVFGQTVAGLIGRRPVLGACWGTEELGWNRGSQKKLRDVR
jgi:hypothetical protein